jgi:trehalose synthase
MPGSTAAPITEVPVPAVSPERFRPLLGDRFAPIEEAIRTAPRVLAGRVIWHVNSTARGGGVAELLHSLLAYARGAGVDVRWLTITGNEQFFELTKRIHNNLHGSPGDGGKLGEAEEEIYNDGLMPSAAALAELLSEGDIIYLHDPQTAGLTRLARDAEVNVIWRCHVGIDKPNELARRAWKFLIPHIEKANAYVFSRREFVWDGLDEEELWIVPPSIDAFSAKNQDLDPDAVSAILATIGLLADGGTAPVFHRQDGSLARVNRRADLIQDAPLPADVPMVAQVSRWDRLKDPAGVVSCFAEHLRHPSAHLVLAGPSVVEVADDPEGGEVLAEVTALRASLPEEFRSRTHLVSLPMDDIEENAAMVNAIQRHADVVLQKSLAEGFGLTVAEAMWKARPVVAGRVGGIQDQIVDGVSGVLVDDPADLAAVGGAIDGLLYDPEHARAIGAAARQRVLDEFLGSRHLVQYMTLIQAMLQKEGQA